MVNILPGKMSECSVAQDTKPQHPAEERDIEKSPIGEELTQTVSAQPYSIFSRKTRIFIVIAVSVSALISPFGATTFYPALNVLSAQLNVTPASVNISVTTYMVYIHEETSLI